MTSYPGLSFEFSVTRVDNTQNTTTDVSVAPHHQAAIARPMQQQPEY